MSHFMTAFQTLPASSQRCCSTHFSTIKSEFCFISLKPKKNYAAVKRTATTRERTKSISHGHESSLSTLTMQFNVAESIDMRINDFGYFCCTRRAFHSTKFICATEMPETQRKRSRRCETWREETLSKRQRRRSSAQKSFFSLSRFSLAALFKKMSRVFRWSNQDKIKRKNQPAYKFCFSET